MRQPIPLCLVRCASTGDQRSEIVRVEFDLETIEDRLISQAEQVVAADELKGLHLAADDPKHGRVTYLQEVIRGGFFVYVGDPDHLQEHWFGPGDWVAFNDHQGLGHASKVGPDGCRRNFRLLRGHIS